jgi:hypothetical protein
MKNLWQSTPDAAVLDEQQVLFMITKRSKSALTALRTNLLTEAVLAALVVLFLAFKAIHASNAQACMALLQICLLILPLFLFYYSGLKSLQKGVTLTQNLREYLREAVHFWESALRVYFWGGVMLFPLVIIAVGWYRMSMRGDYDIHIFGSTIWIIVLKTVGLTVIASLITKVLIQISYGVYIKRLRQYLQELEA